MAAPKVSTLMQVVSGLPRDLKRLHLTFLAPDKVVATFAADNAHELYCWALVASAKMVSGRQPRLLLNKARVLPRCAIPLPSCRSKSSHPV